jgi:glycosyltransferase involved in cell wall biosynthesis
MVSIIIPIFNEESRLRENLAEIIGFLKKSDIKSEIVMVNDGSHDKTSLILEEMKDKFDLKIVNHPKNLGKGAAIKTGVNAATGDIVLFTDIDLSVPIEFLDNYLKVLDDQADVVIGTRAHPDSKVEIRQSRTREFMGEMFTLLTNTILQVGVTDFTCGFKMFRKEAALKIFNKQLIKRWSFDAESLFLAKKFHYKIKEVPVVWRHREGSKVKFPQDIIDSLLGLFEIRLNALLGKYD